MKSFEFTPDGIRERGAEETATSAVIPAAQAVANLQRQVEAEAAGHAKRVAALKTAPARIEPLKRRHFTKELRARLRAVERQIKSLRELEDEAAEIKRLIAALKEPPAKVTPIATARKSG